MLKIRSLSTFQRMDTGKAFCEFVDSCPTPFQFGSYVRDKLTKSGFTELSESKCWNIQTLPKKGFVLRDNRSLIAFHFPDSFNISNTNSSNIIPILVIGTHCDSPCFKIKPNFSADSKDFRRLLVCQYGGGQWFTWFDRELRCAGRVFIKNGENIEPRYFDSREPIAIIPSDPSFDPLSPNTDLELNYNLLTGSIDTPTLQSYIASKLGVSESDIVDYDISFLDSQPASLLGLHNEFVATQRIDNLGSTFSALTAFLNSTPTNSLNVFSCFDHEEIGSNTRLGADSNYLLDTLEKIFGKERIAKIVPHSLCVSADNAHAIHPLYPEKHEKMHAPVMGNGLVIKKSARNSYATELESTYPLKDAAKTVGSDLQILANRNDIPGGSTIGPIIASNVGFLTVDVGQPQLAMHSIRETVAVKDIEESIKIFQELYNNYDQHRLTIQ